jgi:hypothetical protein
MNKKILKDILKRLDKLEQVILPVKLSKLRKNRGMSPEAYKGATGGLRLLIREGFFNGKRLFKEIRSKLEDKGYHYSRQAVQGGLNNLSKKAGPLVVLGEREGKKYARRK